MSITREQVADLQPGDVVEMSWAAERGAQQSVKGPLVELSRGVLAVGGYWVREENGEPIQDAARRTLTVVSRAPRPLYVNSDRIEPVQHDVVRDGQGVIRHCDAAGFGGEPTWWSLEIEPGFRWTHTTRPPQPLTLLVDGETGQVVP